MECLTQGTRVEFNFQSFQGKGTIVGLATTIIGKSYIIEPDEKLESVYDYTHFVVWEGQFKVI
jgi:hypothetical protein